MAKLGLFFMLYTLSSFGVENRRIPGKLFGNISWLFRCISLHMDKFSCQLLRKHRQARNWGVCTTTL